MVTWVGGVRNEAEETEAQQNNALWVWDGSVLMEKENKCCMQAKGKKLFCTSSQQSFVTSCEAEPQDVHWFLGEMNAFVTEVLNSPLPSPSSCYCWAWHHSVWKIPFVYLDKLWWLCPLPASHPPAVYGFGLEPALMRCQHCSVVAKTSVWCHSCSGDKCRAQNYMGSLSDTSPSLAGSTRSWK